MKRLASFLIRLFLTKICNSFLRRNNFVIIFRRGKAIGEHIILTGVINQIYTSEKKKIIIISSYNEFFLNNPKIYKSFQLSRTSYFWFLLRTLKSNFILEYASEKSNLAINKHFLFYHSNKKIHISNAHAEHFPFKLPAKKVKNEIFFSKKEIEVFSNKFKLKNNFVMIQSTSKKDFTSSKEWSFDGMQSIVNYFRNFHWIQIGHKNDPILDNTESYLGLDFRSTAYLISKANFLVTYEGLFNHIASCFNKKNFLIHTGFLPTEASHYDNNILIQKNDKLKCYPCYLLKCSYHKTLYKNYLTRDYIIDVIKKNI